MTQQSGLIPSTLISAKVRLRWDGSLPCLKLHILLRHGCWTTNAASAISLSSLPPVLLAITFCCVAIAVLCCHRRLLLCCHRRAVLPSPSTVQPHRTINAPPPQMRNNVGLLCDCPPRLESHGLRHRKSSARPVWPTVVHQD